MAGSMRTYPLLFCLAITLALCLAAGCGDDETHGDHCTTSGEAMCVGTTQIRYCDGTHYGDAEDCPDGQGCMTMDSGMTHCMPLGMMGGDDAGMSMNHDTMTMHHDGMAMDQDGHGPMGDDAGSMHMGHDAGSMPMGDM